MLKTHEAFKKRTIILWEDLYENHKTSMDLFRKDIVFHTWLSTKNGEEVAEHGHRSIRSTCNSLPSFFLPLLSISVE
jgi:hypothetical protein